MHLGLLVRYTKCATMGSPPPRDHAPLIFLFLLGQSCLPELSLKPGCLVWLAIPACTMPPVLCLLCYASCTVPPVVLYYTSCTMPPVLCLLRCASCTVPAVLYASCTVPD